MNCPIARSSRARPFFSTTKRAPDQFRRGLEIHVAERAAEIVMRLWRKRIVAGRAEHVPLHIAVLVDTLGHFVERQIGNRGQLPGELFVRRFRRGLQLRHRGLQFGDLGHQLRSRAPHPSPSWRRRFPSKRNCAAPAPAPTPGSPRGAFRRSPAATATAAPARGASAPASNACGVVADRFDVVHGDYSCVMAGRRVPVGRIHVFSSP